MGVVVDPPAGHERLQLRRKPLDLRLGGEGHQIEGVRADIANGPARARLLGIGAPRGLLHALAFEVLAQPVLDILDMDQPQLAQIPGLDHGPRLPDHGVASVVVGQHEGRTGLCDQRSEGSRVFPVRGQRLVADDRDPGLQKRLRRREMHVVGRNDGDRVDAIVARGLGRSHSRKVGVDALGRQPQLLARGLRPLRGRGQRARDNLPVAIQPGGHAVHGADKGTLPAADHAEFQGCRHVAYSRPSIRRTAARSAPLSAKSSKAVSVSWMM